MDLSHWLVLHAPEPYKNDGELMEEYCSDLSKLTLTVRACSDMRPIFVKMRLLRLRELHIDIEETVGDENELMRLYRLVKLCSLVGHQLEVFSVTYRANNEDDFHNSVRLMAVVGLLNQLNWNLCKSASLNLHINYLHDAAPLDLIQELPVVLNIHGKTSSDEDVAADQAQLKMLALSYPYLEGII